MRFIQAVLALLATALSSTILDAATYEVAQRHPQASDDGPGSLAQPWKTLSQAAARAGAGDRVIIHSGVYRETVTITNGGRADAPIRFEAGPGEHVVVTGADRLTGWRKADDGRPIYSVAWPHRFIGWNRNMAHPDDEYHRVIGRCEQVIVEDYLLRQVLSADQLAPGTFYADITNKTLRVWDMSSRDLNKVYVEASVRPDLLQVQGDYVQCAGICFRYAANMAQHGAVTLAGRGDQLEDCVLERMNSGGATFRGEDEVVRRCVFRDNGQIGFGANRAHRLRFTGCLVENNNTKGFNRGWEAGGNKLVLCRDAVLERSRFVGNRGSGIWFDIGNTNCTVRQCLIADNEDAGIFYEISFALRAQDNVIVGNGFATTVGAWGAQAGICLSSSPFCVLERNLLYGNREGFNFREQMRTTPTVDDRNERPVWNHDQVIRHNLIVRNRDAQIWGWFDSKGNRHWPASEAIPVAPAAGAKPGDIAGPYTARNNQDQPEGLTLEKLRIQFDGNVYYAAPDQGWFTWGPGWTRHKSYANLEEFRSGLHIDQDSQEFDPPFADVRQLDFRLPSNALKQIEACYPRGPVPGVVLGSR